MLKYFNLALALLHKIFRKGLSKVFQIALTGREGIHTVGEEEKIRSFAGANFFDWVGT